MKLLLSLILPLIFTSVLNAQPGGNWHEVPESERAVILIGGAEGGLAWQYLPHQVQSLKDTGMSVYQTSYFNAEGQPALLEEIPIEYFNQVIDWVARRKTKLFVIAHSRGTEAALLSALHTDKVTEVIALSPSSHVFQGIKRSLEATLNDRRSSWSIKATPLPFAPFAMNEAQLKETEEAAKQGQMCACVLDVYKQSLATAPEDARIPVEKISTPILLISSDNDPIWPAQTMASNMIEKRTQAKLKTEHWKVGGGHMPHTQDDIWNKILARLNQ